MAKNQIPIVKLSRRLGIVLGKEKYVRRRPYPPGVHGPKQGNHRRISGYGEQLLEKQKAKAVYGLLEKQFRKCFEKASQHKGNTAEFMIQLLEQRLDNVVYRLGFAKTRRQARQLVGHGFVLVNNKLVDIPSYSVSVGEVISVKENKKEKGIVKAMGELHQENQVPKWLSADVAALTGKVTGEPQADDVEKVFDPRLIVEFYSR
jgi:small subunit ribosomal protein S4